MDSMNPQQVVVVTRLRAREAEKRKGEDGIIANFTSTDIVTEEIETESKNEEIMAEDEEAVAEDEVRDDKYFVKLTSKEPSKDVYPMY